MKKNFFKNVNFTSIEDASILRKFTVLFLLMSLIPVGILYYFYLQIKDYGTLQITEGNYSLTLAIVIAGVVVGYWAMRSVLKKLIDVTRSNQQTLELVLGPEKIRDLAKEKNEIAVLARSFSEMTTQLEDNIKNLELAKRTLHSVLNRVGQGISSMQNIDTFLELIVETVVDAFSGRVGVLLLTSDNKKEMYVKSLYGTRIEPTSQMCIKFDEEPVASIIRDRKPMIIREIKGSSLKSKEFNALFELPMLLSPLIIHDNLLGIIGVCGKTMGADDFHADEINLMKNLSLQTAVAVENSKLSEDVEKTYFETISALALAVDAKDKYSRGHLDRVASYAVTIAKALNLGEGEIKTLRDAARLHDVGKIGVPDEILLKPSSLSDQEMVMMKKHTEIGESIIKPIRSLSHLCDLIRHHHEKLDGSGYPDGLKGDQISILVRIITVADIYDALTTDRPYRKKFSIEEACQKMIDMKGALDQSIVEAFIKTLD